MKHTRFYTAILLGMMVLNIAKYQLPHIEYNLFKNYIAENLCVKKNEANNCCQGKCFLEKQIGLVNEADNQSANPTEKKPIQLETDDYVKDADLPVETLRATSSQISHFEYDARLPKTNLNIDSPPPKRLS
jgi:hypothetical protein